MEKQEQKDIEREKFILDSCCAGRPQFLPTLKGIGYPKHRYFMRTIICKYKKCGKKFKTSKKNKRFCSEICRTRDNSKKRYYKLKDKPEYKEKKREYIKKWQRENHKHYLNLVREANKLRGRKIRAFRRKNKLCPRCGKQRDSKRLSCLDCRTKYNKWQRKKYEKKSRTNKFQKIV